MQKALDTQEEDGKQRDKMLDKITNQSTLQKKILEIEKEIANLKNQRVNNTKVNYNQQEPKKKQELSRGNLRPTGKLYEPKMCYYCQWEGHATFKCLEGICQPL